MFVVDESKIVNGTYKGVMQVFSYDNANEIELPWSGQFLVLLRNQFGALPVVDYFEGNRYKLNEAIYHYRGSNVLEFIKVGETRKTMVLVPLRVQVSAYNMENDGIKGAYIPELEKEIQKVLEVIRNSGTNVTNKEKAFLNNLKFIEKELTDKTNVVFGKVEEVLNEVALVEQESERFLSLVRENELLVNEKYHKFDTDITEANQTIDDILALQPQFQAVLDETTGKDVISAPEIILARGGEADLKTRLDKEHQQVTAQLAHTEQQTRKATANTTIINPPIPTKKAYMTITDDDIHSDVWTKLKPISEELGVPMSIAAISSYVLDRPAVTLTKEQLLYLQNSLGWEIVNHTHSHLNMRVMNEEEIEYQFTESNKYFKEWGLDIKNFIAPYGSNDFPLVREVSAKYFNCGVRVGGGVNFKPIKNQFINRVPLGSFTTPGKNTLESYKSRVDEAIAKDGWLVFMTHCSEADHDSVQNQHLRDVIIYAQSRGVEIVNLQEGYEKMGNILEVEGLMSIDREGIVHSKQLDVTTTLSLKGEIGEATSPNTIKTLYPKNLVLSNYEYIDAQNFPETQPGTLLTNTVPSVDGIWQEWKPYKKNSVYRRYSNIDGSAWSEWVDWSVSNDSLSMSLTRNVYTGSTLIERFPNNKITVFSTDLSGGVGFPNDNAGICQTFRNGGNGIDYQTYKEYGKRDNYIRYVKTDGTWDVWDKVTTQLSPNVSTTVDRPIITTQGQMHFDTTLNRPIWRNASNTAWIDSTGTTV